MRSLLDLLDTENEILTAKIDYTNAYYDRIYACYWLTETMGKLLESLELEAPMQALTIASPDSNPHQALKLSISNFLKKKETLYPAEKRNVKAYEVELLLRQAAN